MVVAMVSLHKRPFAVAVGGSAVFALCTVLSSVAVSWVIDNVIQPRFDEGEVARSTLITGIVYITVVGVVRAAGVVVRRVFAGITQFSRRGHARSWGRRPARAPARVVASAATRRRPRRPGRCRHRRWHRCARPDPVRHRHRADDRRLGGVAARHRLGARRGGGGAVPDPHRRERRSTSATSSSTSIAAQDELGRLSAAVHESFEGVQLVKAYGAEQRETERLSVIAGRFRDARVHAVTLRGTFESVLDVLPSLTNVALVVVGAMRVQSGHVTVGELAGFIYLFTLLVFPLAADRLRVLGAPALAVGLEPRPRGPRRADRARSEELDRVCARRDRAAAATASRSRSRATITPCCATSTSRCRTVGSWRSSAPPAPARARSSSWPAVSSAPSAGASRRAGVRSIVFQEAFLFGGTIRDNVVLGDGVRRRGGVDRAASGRRPTASSPTCPMASTRWSASAG